MYWYWPDPNGVTVPPVPKAGNSKNGRVIVPSTLPVADSVVYATYCSWPLGMYDATYASATTPGVFTPAASKGNPIGSVSVYVTLMTPLLVILAELMVITKPGRTKSTRAASA